LFPIPIEQIEFLNAVDKLNTISPNLIGTRSAEKDEIVAKELGDSLQMIVDWLCKVEYSNGTEGNFSTQCLLIGPSNNVLKDKAIIFKHLIDTTKVII